MSKKGFSAKRLAFKLSMLLIIPLVLLTQLPGPTGQPVLSLADLTPALEVESFSSKFLRQSNETWVSFNQWLLGETVTGREARIAYRYRDARGQWVYTDTPPTSLPVEAVDITDRSMQLAEPDAKLSRTLASQKAKPSTKVTSSEVPFNTTLIKNVLSEAKNTQESINTRHSALDDF